MEKTIFYCEKCDYRANKLSHWEEHISTKKHANKNQTNFTPECYDCKLCDVKCSHLSILRRHEKTKGHIKKCQSPPENYDCTLCNVKCYHLSTFNRHKQTKGHKKSEAQIINVISSLENAKKTHKKNRKKLIPLTLKRKVWEQQIGEDIGKSKCLCCRLTDITQLSFHCGHIISEANGGEIKLDNLRPICQSCNSSMGTVNMDEFINKYGLTAKEVLVNK